MPVLTLVELHINMNIYHQRFGRLETEMYFQEHPYNKKKDYQYLAYDYEERKMLTAQVHKQILS